MLFLLGCNVLPNKAFKNVSCTCNASKGAVGHVAGCSLQIVLINQLKLVLVTVLHVPRSPCIYSDQTEQVCKLLLKVKVVLTKHE